MILKEGRFKDFLYAVKIIPLYRSFQEYRYDRKFVNRKYPNRWYFRFLPIKKNKIVFDNYLGQGYGDNARAIAEEILKQQLDFDIVWLTSKNEKIPEQIRQVTYGSSQAMRELATAKIWAFNTRSVTHPRKRKSQIYLQTWHGGYPLKKIEKEAEKELSLSYVNLAKKDGAITDGIISSSEFFTSICENSFWLSDKAEILRFGVPKNDILFIEETKSKISNSIRNKYHISSSDSIILYFPTFRDDHTLGCYNLDYDGVLRAFEQRFKKDFVLLVRFHPNLINDGIINDSSIEWSDRIINVTDYPEATGFFCIADYMISDYSGVMLAFSLQKKPVFIFASDIEKYIKERGFNSLYDQLPCSKCQTNEELIDQILKFDENTYSKRISDLIEYIGPYDDGQASKRTVDWIIKQIGHRGEK